METDRLILREFSYSDTTDLFQIRSDPRIMEFMDSPKHQSLADSKEKIVQMLDSYLTETGINWAIEDKHTGKMIGYIAYWHIIKEHVRAELGYALKTHVWGKGFMKEALRAVLQFGFQEMKLHSVGANVNPENLASAKLLKSVGFQREGHFRENYFFNGRFIDSDIYSLIESDFQPYL